MHRIPDSIYVFVDGAYLRKASQRAKTFWVEPRMAVSNTLGQPLNLAIQRTTYYGARPDDLKEVPAELAGYWEKIELLEDTDLGWGRLRGGDRRSVPTRQKGVDVLLAVDMMTNAFSKNYEQAVLVAGDADFVPVIHEVRRFGVKVLLVAPSDGSVARELIQAADRYLAINMGNVPHIQRPDSQFFGNPTENF